MRIHEKQREYDEAKRVAFRYIDERAKLQARICVFMHSDRSHHPEVFELIIHAQSLVSMCETSINKLITACKTDIPDMWLQLLQETIAYGRSSRVLDLS
jgi:hypothetical protein